MARSEIGTVESFLNVRILCGITYELMWILCVLCGLDKEPAKYIYAQFYVTFRLNIKNLGTTNKT